MYRMQLSSYKQVQVKTHVWFLNLIFVSENITSELAETHTLTVKQLCCLNVQSIAADKLVGLEALGPVATTLSEFRRLSETW
jgi:hypothetical protein